MSWFNVLYGAYPSLQQVNKVLPVASGETGIVRGSLIWEDPAAAGAWKLMTASEATEPRAYAFIALNAQTDLTAGMAGSNGQGTNKVWNGSAIVAGSAVVTGLATGMPFEFETTEYTGQLAVGTLLTSGASGKLVAHTTGDNCIAQVTKAAASKWQNDAVAVTGFRTGANVNVIQARTLVVPLLATA